MSWATHINMMVFDFNGHTAINKKLAFSDRSAAFCFNLNKLLKLASIESLRFIAEMAQRLESADFNLENDRFQDVMIKQEQLSPLITDIDHFFSWCSSHIPEVCKAFRDYGCNEEEIKIGIAGSADYTPDQLDDDTSDTPDFSFCAIRSIQGVLQYGKGNNLSVTYNNLVEC